MLDTTRVEIGMLVLEGLIFVHQVFAYYALEL